jgi:NAD(P)-dependent dehydrogenase (short-subunit alcohol dehydrogenase family)
MAPTTWFITGTSSGFGRSLTEQLLERGDRVAATLRTPSRLDDLTARYDPEQLWVRALDVTDTQQLRDVVDAAWAALGTIDVVVSNAGNGVLGAAEELSDEHIDQVIATNLVASMQLVRAVAPHLRAQGGGHILQLSSMGGQTSFPGFSLYHASKWGIEGFFDAVAPELEPFGIHTTLIEPGMIRTPFFDAAVREPEHPAYADHPNISRQDIPPEEMRGDMDKIARAMIDVGLMADPPRRRLLGSDAYTLVHDALTARLAEAEAGRALASTTDRDDVGAAAA